MAVRVGVLLPQGGWSVGPESIRSFVAKAYELGFASLWLGDHICLPARQDTPYPYPMEGEEEKSYQVPSDRPYLEALTTLGFVSAVTTGIEVGLSVGIMPYRHPLVWAKSLATLQRLSSNRLIIGVGTGWMAEEFNVLGADFADRAGVTDETVAFLRQVWEPGGPVQFRGDRFAIENFWVVPPGPDERLPPIWVGGNGPAAIERTARQGDVWHPYLGGTSPAKITEGLRKLAEWRERLERPGLASAAVHMPWHASPGSSPQPPWEIGTIVGDARAVRDVVLSYGDVGVEHVVLNFGGSTRRRLEFLDDLADSFGGDLGRG
jgi:probable F420-dependent oxidoreductase